MGFDVCLDPLRLIVVVFVAVWCRFARLEGPDNPDSLLLFGGGRGWRRRGEAGRGQRGTAWVGGQGGIAVAGAAVAVVGHGRERRRGAGLAGAACAAALAVGHHAADAQRRAVAAVVVVAACRSASTGNPLVVATPLVLAARRCGQTDRPERRQAHRMLVGSRPLAVCTL